MTTSPESLNTTEKILELISWTSLNNDIKRGGLLKAQEDLFASGRNVRGELNDSITIISKNNIGFVLEPKVKSNNFYINVYWGQGVGITFLYTSRAIKLL